MAGLVRICLLASVKNALCNLDAAFRAADMVAESVAHAKLDWKIAGLHLPLLLGFSRNIMGWDGDHPVGLKKPGRIT